MRWINEWIIQWSSHSYNRLWQLIALWLNFLAIKASDITGIVLWRSGWMLKNRGQMRWIHDWIIQWKSHRYHRWLQLVALWVTVLAIKAPVITRSHSLPTLIVPCHSFVATTNTHWMWHNELNMSLWWCCVPVILFVDGHQKFRFIIFFATTAVVFEFQYQE